MKRFILKVGLFLSIIALVDCIFGFTLDEVTNRTDKGGAGRSNYICDKLNDDILVFGTSRARNHYNPKIFGDSLGLPCYNCGEPGFGIIHNYGWLHMIMERHMPKLVIYDVTPDFDYYACDNHRFLLRLKPKYNRIGIDSILWDVDSSEKYKMMSGMYRHNSVFLQNVLSFFWGETSPDPNKGFEPIFEDMDTMKIRKSDMVSNSKKRQTVDPLKMQYIYKLVEMTKQTKLVFVVSPNWYGFDPVELEPIKEICKETNVIFADFSNNSKYVHNNYYFKDGGHLNARGADEFTKDFVSFLKNDE